MRVLCLALLTTASLWSYGSCQQQFRSCVSGRSDCCDSHRFCVFWSQRNECNTNPRWMRKNCQMSCNSCASTTTTRPSFPSVPSPSLPSRDPSAPGGCNSVQSIEVETRRVFSFQQIRARFAQIGCAETQSGSDCSVNMCYHQKFRSIDGTCNNLQQTNKGAAFTPFSRLQPSAYDDGVSTLVASTTRTRASPRELSAFLLSNGRVLNTQASSMLMQFGQFISHDITRTAGNPVCKCQSGGPQCANVPVTSRDRRSTCVAFTRSVPVCGTSVRGRPREQFNENTAFIDGSSVYASEAITARALRTNAFLVSQTINNRVFPPNNGRATMTAGDDRAAIFVGLAALHTSFLRLHNNIASRLTNMNRQWSTDRVFQETRKIVGAVIQVIVYQEFLPKLLGPFHDRLVPTYNRYDPSTEPSVMNEFASAAYRLHGMIHEDYPLLDQNFQEVGRLRFSNGVNNVGQILGSVDAIFRGLIATPARAPQRITTSVTEDLFDGQVDMATFNIQRGRDHGLSPYNAYRAVCNLRQVTSFQDWPEVTDENVRKRVAMHYQNRPENMDLYVGGLLEEPIDGAIVGPTFSCIIAEQFVRLRDGDRFYYENTGIFTAAQLAALKKTSLSWVLCETGDSMTRVARDAFSIDNGRNAVPCSSIPSLDLSAWKE